MLLCLLPCWLQCCSACGLLWLALVGLERDTHISSVRLGKFSFISFSLFPLKFMTLRSLFSVLSIIFLIISLFSHSVFYCIFFLAVAVFLSLSSLLWFSASFIFLVLRLTITFFSSFISIEWVLHIYSKGLFKFIDSLVQIAFSYH